MLHSVAFWLRPNYLEPAKSGLHTKGLHVRSHLVSLQNLEKHKLALPCNFCIGSLAKHHLETLNYGPSARQVLCCLWATQLCFQA